MLRLPFVTPDFITIFAMLSLGDRFIATAARKKARAASALPDTNKIVLKYM
jgi:hypothetical protein